MERISRALGKILESLKRPPAQATVESWDERLGLENRWRLIQIRSRAEKKLAEKPLAGTSLILENIDEELLPSFLKFEGYFLKRIKLVGGSVNYLNLYFYPSDGKHFWVMTVFPSEKSSFLRIGVGALEKQSKEVNEKFVQGRQPLEDQKFGKMYSLTPSEAQQITIFLASLIEKKGVVFSSGY